MAGANPEMNSVWLRRRRSRDQPALSREQIVSEAVRLLDTEGLDALSMRRLGTRLDAGATSLYRHVANRDELIELVVDQVYGEIDVLEARRKAEWRSAAVACARSTRTMILRHPWVATLLGQVGLAHLGPNVIRLNDRMLAVFEKAGFEPVEADQALGTLMAYVIGMGVSEAAWLTTVARSEHDEQAWARRLEPLVREAAEQYPRLLVQAELAEPRDPQQARDVHFDYGMERVLDGLAGRLD